MLLATFGITSCSEDQTEAIGVVLRAGIGAVHIHCMSQTTALEAHVPLVAEEDVRHDAYPAQAEKWAGSDCGR